MKYRMKDLENFAATAVCETMGEASRKLGVSQPSLSESIKRLEDDVGAAVFYRSRSGIRLTPRGKQFYSRVNQLLGSIQELELQTNDVNIFGGQSISIGCHLTVASYTLPSALMELRKMAPDFKVELLNGLSRNIQTDVQRGRIDVGIVVNPVIVPDLVISKIGSDEVAVWNVDGGATDTLIYNPHLFQSQVILKKWKTAPFKTIETDGLDLICRLCEAGLGYGIIPKKAVELSSRKLKAIKSLPTFKDEVAIVYRPEFGRSNAEKALIKAIRSTMSGLKK